MGTGDSGSPHRVLVVTSAGGVLRDVLALQPWWSRRDTIWVAVRAPDTVPALADHDVVWTRELHRGLGTLAVGFARALRVLRRERADLVLSAGTGVAVPYFVAARLLRIPSVWLSTSNLVRSAGLAARLCSRLASSVLVQRASMVDAHPGSRVLGELY
jgi:hypothetical protein